MDSPILPLPPMWRPTLAHLSHLMIGIVWTDLGVPYQGVSSEVFDLYQNLILLLDLLLHGLHSCALRLMLIL